MDGLRVVGRSGRRNGRTTGGGREGWYAASPTAVPRRLLPGPGCRRLSPHPGPAPGRQKTEGGSGPTRPSGGVLGSVGEKRVRAPSPLTPRRDLAPPRKTRTGRATRVKRRPDGGLRRDSSPSAVSLRRSGPERLSSPAAVALVRSPTVFRRGPMTRVRPSYNRIRIDRILRSGCRTLPEKGGRSGVRSGSYGPLRE